ncbi:MULTISPECIES: single-stranded-DNA-specific exonuclease RecJ [unclassified Pseudoxanthomonas]|uniref:single-stranded-DNA-specific exonuclease RecJ n=1 Tax=unclassified Pseudoxanthomonas TaxID=2645906 RepID=UPI0008EB866F|nr:MULTISPECIES: single-stranded-DNA-specific exonuclease RecJ [unclassified Pseudoxanthomonas]PPJ42677.1 single-stranded-DNA-specific exonuclease RecJ [Pseudoxanthomonas sp. KAs_5_3]SFV26564.1 single-stranded-DNA-specific exonuclease [Pseudoxanthomonas sp. YR558]
MKSAARIRRRDAGVAGTWPATVPILLQRVYEARGASSMEQAQPRLAQLLPPDLLGGMDAATAMLADAIVANRHIVIVGDFDCDGATACAVGVRGLRLLGARRVTPAVPNRMVHGYGLSPSLVEELDALSPELLVTVDHGIACHAGITAAKARGWQVLVTDHHLPGDALPPADAIVNPNLRGDPFPSKVLAGVGVMFYVLLALRRVLRERCAFDGPEPDLSSLLDLVAVGTVADLVPLDANNRALVGAGLRRLRAGQASAGLQALVHVAGRDAARLTAADIGFSIAPRLNAAGRLEDMALGIACLLTDDATQAGEMARVLDGINAERRGVQQQMVEEAHAALARIDVGGAVPLAPCLFDPEWHPGVVGLVASKIKERLHRPVIAFAPAEPGSNVLRGSARSIPGFHIRDALAAIDATNPGLMQRFGGHAMAAGLSLDESALPDFREAFQEQASKLLDEAMLQEVLLSDGELLSDELDRAHAEALRGAGPWGQGFPEPMFDGRFDVLDWRVIGEKHLKLSLRLPGHAGPLNAIHFNGWHDQPPPSRIHAAYQLETDDWQNRRGIQLLIRYWQAAD